jgi:hypothetical protein
MQEIWESYMKPVDGRPAAVAFNAEAAETAPDAALAIAGFVKVALCQPTEEGLICDAEADEIGFIEDRLEFEVLRYRIGKYMGRIVSDGEVHFIFYLSMDFEWPDIAEVALGAFGTYSYSAASRPDPEWEIYFKLLYPTVREWQMIHNHHTCEQLQSAGDNLRLPRAIEHRAYFDTEEQAAMFQAQIEAERFTVSRKIAPDDAQTMYGLLFYRIDSPYFYDIDALTLKLIDWTEAFEGQYDGWETSLVKM